MKIDFKPFAPVLPGTTVLDRMACSCGALAGIGVTALIGFLSLGHEAGLPFLVAPMGASAVLVFAVPSSPLAQPWAVIGGNTIGAVVGVFAASTIRDPLVASAVAVALAIVVMSFMRCLHPPGGAAALTTVLGGPAVVLAGYKFALFPMALNSVVLVAMGWLFHKLSRHRYPHWHSSEPVNPHRTMDALAGNRVGFNASDVDAALADIGESFDIDRDDLDQLLRRIELRSFARLCGNPSCGEVMSRDLITIEQRANIALARELMLQHGIRSLPVIDASGCLRGVVGLRELGRPSECVMDAMIDPLTCVPQDSAFDLVPRLSDGNRHAVVVTNAEQKPVGMITQTDLLAVVARRHLVSSSS